MFRTEGTFGRDVGSGLKAACSRLSAQSQCKRALSGRPTNTPFLIVGDSPQPLVTRVSTADAAKYFDDRQAHGFNALWINVIELPARIITTAPMMAAPTMVIRPLHGATSPAALDTAHYDLSKPNEAYFARVDQILSDLGDTLRHAGLSRSSRDGPVDPDAVE